MKNNDFCVFILTHGRADNVVTYKTLQKYGYTGPIYFVVDNEDKQADKYKQYFGSDNVMIFDKKAYADSIDEGNNFDERRTITHARNACFDIALKLGYKYFCQLDDDYTDFMFRMDNNQDYPKKYSRINSVDNMFDNLLDFYKKIPVKSIAISQGGDWIGGGKNPANTIYPLKRKCMNSFICSTDRPFNFIGAMNEDVNTYTTLGSRGDLFFTVMQYSLTQKQTQSQGGGITDMYLKFGTYCKAFTTVMMNPASVKVKMMQTKNPRLHHAINWKLTTPMIIDEKYKKI